MGRLPHLLLVLLMVAACEQPAPTPAPAPRPAATAADSGAGPPATPAPAPAATPALPPNYIESLRAHPRPGGKLEIGELMWRGAGFSKFHVSWPSGGQTYTGTISLPDGPGPFPVVIVNHGHIPVDRYWIGQDSGIFGDPMAEHGFIALAPNYVGYNGSGPGEPGLPTNMQIAITDMDLISSLSSLAQADPARIGVVGHSQGGGVAQILMVTEPRIKAVVLHAPVSSDERENARRLQARTASPPPLGDPDQNAELYRHVSPRNYFAGGQPPVLLIQGALDHTIPAEHTQATYDALRAAGVTTQLVFVPGADHDLVGADLANAVAAQEAWIRKALG